MKKSMILSDVQPLVEAVYGYGPHPHCTRKYLLTRAGIARYVTVRRLDCPPGNACTERRWTTVNSHRTYKKINPELAIGQQFIVKVK